MEEAEATVAALRRLRDLGVRLAIDDFGAGYSSLSYLRSFPVDILKIDRSFVQGLGRDRRNSSIAGAIVSLAHALALTAIAEGVETEEQLATLRGLGCDVAQGFLFARPVAPEELEQTVAAGRLSADGGGLGSRFDQVSSSTGTSSTSS